MARYLISEAARQTGVEAHVLRFWEEELQLEIPRNEQGHRYYTEGHIEIFEQIKRMKLQGFQLRAIKDSLTQQVAAGEAAPTVQEMTDTAQQAVGSEGETNDTRTISIPVDRSEKKPMDQRDSDKLIGLSHSDKLVEFESIVYDIVTEALRNNNERQAKDISDRVGDKVVKEMNYLMRENEEHLEEHFRKLDEALLRRGRKAKTKQEKEAAATKVTKLPVVSQTKKKHRLFPRKRKTTIY